MYINLKFHKPLISIRTIALCLSLAISLSLLGGALALGSVYAQADNPNPPSEVVKLIFIHHSTGEDWLADDHGGLGRALGENNYFVSDTNYGWGPDSIGDRTDVPDWPEWFRSSESERYLGALYNESGQNSWYTRDRQDPGGENEIIMFKSCFPNSDISGSPNDPAQPGYDFTVGNFKYIYNDLLNYFQTRPDKLFVVITPPPLIDSTHAENARAFSNWLVHDWLAENGYPLNNVMVFDFHNVLTHPDNHHRYQGGGIEHIINNGNGALFYDSDGDDHPNAAGDQKATAEFIPLLNLYYHRWKSGAPQSPVEEPTAAPPVEATEPPDEDEPVVAPYPAVDGLIDDFEAGPPAGANSWTAYWDESTPTIITCGPEGGLAFSGSNALHVIYDVEYEAWASCTLEYETAQDWSAWRGLSFYMHASQAGLYINVDTFDDEPDGWAAYLHVLETTQEMVDGWAYVELPWEMLLGAEWDGHAGEQLNPTRVAAIALGIDGYREGALEGQVWVDEIRLLGASGPPPEPTSPPEEPPAEPEPIGEPGTLPEEEDNGGGLPDFCPGSASIGGLALVGLVLSRRRSRTV